MKIKFGNKTGLQEATRTEHEPLGVPKRFRKGSPKGSPKGGSAAQKGGRRRRLLQDGGDIGVASSSSSGFGFHRRLTSNKQTPLFVEIGAQAHRARRRARSPLTREQVENLATNESISLSVAPLIYRLNAGEYCGSIETCKIHCIDNLFESTGGPFSTAKNFCKKIEKPWKCSFPTERLSPCREGLSCSAVSKCKKDTGDAQGHKPDKSPTSKATCLHNCQRNSPCTGATGFGLQQLTDFSTGMFSAQPTGTTATRVYATGVCYECKIGPDLHFRCPQIGRRRSLMELVSTHVKKTDKLTDHELLGRALSDVMHAGADVCFDKRLKGNLDLPTDKVDATLVVCNERIELPVSSDAKAFKYAGTMAVVGAFNPSFVEGFSPTDMDTRFFNFGYTVKVESGVASFPAESSDVCDVITPFDKDTSYRKKLAEVYGVYWRARNKGVSRITPCLPAPTMDFREIVSPSTGKVHYGSVQFFGVNIAINDPEIAFRSTRAAFTCSKATGAYNILSLVGIGGGADAVYCAGGEGDVPRRLAQLEDSSMPKAKDQEARNVQFDAAVAFVISLVSEYDGLNIMKASSKGEDMKWIAMTKNCDKGTRDKGFWKKLMDDHIGEANVWGVVDEAIFVNNSPSIGVVPGKPNPPPLVGPKLKGKLFYGGNLCATFERESHCFQYAMPLNIVVEDQPIKSKGKEIAPGTFEYYQQPHISNQIFIYGIKDTKRDTREKCSGRGCQNWIKKGCTTGKVPNNLFYFWAKTLISAGLKGNPKFATKCPGSMLS